MSLFMASKALRVGIVLAIAQQLTGINAIMFYAPTVSLFCFVLFCFVLFCFVLFCFVLFCFVLFCFVLFEGT